MSVLADDALVIGLGGNVGDDAAILQRFTLAREALAMLGDVHSAPIYRTAPISVTYDTMPVGSMTRSGQVQAAFLNSAVRVRYPEGTAGELRSTVAEIERLLGRDRRAETRWGPRAIDLDVLWDTMEHDLPHLADEIRGYLDRTDT